MTESDPVARTHAPETPEITRVAVIGAGTMGHGIAQVIAMAGCEVTLYDVAAVPLQAGLDKIKKNLDQGVSRGKVEPDVAEQTLMRLEGTTDLAVLADEADLIIEAVPERLELKQSLFRAVGEHAEEHAIFATNTSSLSVADIASAAPDPRRVLGLHFFNPVHIMALLEIVVHTGTDADVLEACRDLGVRIGKTCITVRDSPGFATSRLGVCLGMEAIRMLEEGVASAHDIDTAMVLGYRHPIGPLKLTDLVGLDVRLAIGEYLASTLGNPAFAPPALLRSMVAEGRLGQKAGVGFYEW